MLVLTRKPLVLTRKPNESIILEIPNMKPITVTMLEGGKLGFDAPEEVKIIREELLTHQAGYSIRQARVGLS